MRIKELHIGKILLTLLIILSANIYPLLALPGVSLDVEPREITVGDPVEVVLRLQPEPGTTVHWPPAEAFAPAEVLDTDTLEVKGEEQAVRYQISLYEPGSSEISDLPLVLASDTGLKDTIWVDPGIITVLSILAPEDSLSNIRDIKPPVTIPITWRDIMPYAIGAAIALLLGIVAWYLWRRYKKSKGEIPEYVPPPPPPYDLAMRKLEQLRVKELWQQGKTKEFYSELSEIIKHYMDGRFGFDAPEMTSMELIWARKKWARTDDEYKLVKKIIDTADMVKFAKFRPPMEIHPECMDAGFEYLQKTRPKLEPDAGFTPDGKKKPETEEVN